MPSVFCEDMQITIIDPDDVMSLCQISLPTKCKHAQDRFADGKKKERVSFWKKNP